jgi:hypothetical protein
VEKASYLKIRMLKVNDGGGGGLKGIRETDRAASAAIFERAKSR